MSSSEVPVLSVLRSDVSPQNVWASLYPVVQGMVRRALGLDAFRFPDPDQEDLIAEGVYATLHNVVRYRGSFRGETEPSARAWLRAVSSHASRRHASRRHRRNRCFVPMDPHDCGRLMDAVKHDSPEARGLDHDFLCRAIPSPTLRTIWLLYNEPGVRRSHSEVARLTGHGRGSIPVLLSRARGMLRKAMMSGAHAFPAAVPARFGGITKRSTAS